MPLPQNLAHGWLLFEREDVEVTRQHRAHGTILDVLGADALRYFLLREIVFDRMDRSLRRAGCTLQLRPGQRAGHLPAHAPMITRYFKGEVPYPSRAATHTAEECHCRDCAPDDHAI